MDISIGFASQVERWALVEKKAVVLRLRRPSKVRLKRHEMDRELPSSTSLHIREAVLLSFHVEI